VIDCIGFMQGRLCQPVDNKIQSFPWRDWKNEFSAAEALDLHFMEWTLDQERLNENPLMTADGQIKIRKLCQRYDVSIPSLTGDCFMQAPFWKAGGKVRTDLQSDFRKIILSCSAVGIQFVVVPLVDNGSLETDKQEDILVDFLLSHKNFLAEHKMKVIFESDFTPSDLARFIARLPVDQFGINYDMGNSAALGYAPTEEFAFYGERIVNVHVKDRIFGGTTVPLGSGDVDFSLVFSELEKIKYRGNYILQSARALDDDHIGAISTYRDMVCQLLVSSRLPLS